MKQTAFCIGLFALLLMVGCSRMKWVAGHLDKVCVLCPEKTHETIINNETTTVDIDTVWTVSQADSLLIVALAKCDSLNRAQMEAMTVNSSGASATISIVDNVLQATIECHEDSLMNIIQRQRTELSHKETSIETVVREVKTGRFYVWFFWIVAAICAVYLAFKIYKLKKSKNG